MKTLNIEYGGASLSLEYETLPDKETGLLARLKVNGIVRETVDSGAINTRTFRLSSTVQTDYEWHEFIEGIIEYKPESVHARIVANNEILITEESDRSGQ